MIWLEMYGIGPWKPTVPTFVLVVGGNFNYSGSAYPVSYSNYNNPTNSYSNNGVRGALYM